MLLLHHIAFELFFNFPPPSGEGMGGIHFLHTSFSSRHARSERSTERPPQLCCQSDTARSDPYSHTAATSSDGDRRIALRLASGKSGRTHHFRFSFATDF